MNNIILFIQEYTSKMSCRIITSVLSLLFSPFPVLKASSLEFVHPWRVWKTRNVIQSQKALVRHAVMMETEVHARNWSFVIALSSTIQSLPTFPERRRAPLTGLTLFSIKRANAIQTLLDMTTPTLGTEKTLTHKNFLKLSAEEKDQYMRYINMSRYCISNYVVTLTPNEEINKTVTQQHSFTTSATMTCSCGSTTMLHEAPFSHITWHGEILTLRMTCRGFLRGIDCIIQ